MAILSFLALTSWVACFPLLAQDSGGRVVKTLFDFESAAELAAWQPRRTVPQTTFEYSTEHASNGRGSAKWTTPSAKESGQEWPAVILPGAGLPVRDLRPFETFAFEAFNPGDAPVEVKLYFRDGDGVNRTRGVDVKPGANTLRVPLADLASDSPLQEFQFFLSSPTEGHTLYFDHVRLESADLNEKLQAIAADFARVRNSIAMHLHEEGEKTEPQVAGELASCNTRVLALRTGLTELLNSAEVSALEKWEEERRGVQEAIAKLENLAPVLRFEAAFADADWGYGRTSGIDKVFREDGPFRGQIGGTLRVELAADEYEGVQLVLRAKRTLHNVRVSVGRLESEDGAMIDPDRIEVLPVGYVNTKRPPYEVDYVGWWPDPLLDYLDVFDLDAGVWQPVWLDVHTRPEQRPGTYRGTVRVTADGVEPLLVPLEVHVWNFAVPVEYHLPLAVVFSEGKVPWLYGKGDEEGKRQYTAYCEGRIGEGEVDNPAAKEMLAARRACHDMILDHRLIPDNIYRAVPPRLDDVKRWAERGARWFNILHVPSQPHLQEGQPYPEPLKDALLAKLDAFIPELKKTGLFEMAYIYGFDEVRPNQFAAMKDIFGEIKRRYPDIPIMTTAYDHSYGAETGLDEYVDIWVPLTPKYEQTAGAVEAARRRGREVWWYICCGPRHPYANWFVEYTAAEHRLIMGFMPHKFASEGFLHYQMNYWATNQTVTAPDGTTSVRRNAPYPDVMRGGPLTNMDGKAWTDYNGDGQIMYPGEHGPVSTIRMKCIRDGLEDYEYLWLLAGAVDAATSGKLRVDADWLNRAEAALAVNAGLVKSLTEYSTDGADILSARSEIAALLEEAAAEENPSADRGGKE